MNVTVVHWPGGEPVTKAAILHMFQLENLQPYRWSDAPGDVYSAHTHDYHKVIYVVSGSITFGLPREGQTLLLRPGDRLDLPSGVIHDATVGPEGVVCLEAHRG